MSKYTKASFLEGKVTLYGGDNRDVLRDLPDDSIDSIVTDPPYALVSIVKRFGGTNAKPANDNDVYARASAGFMGKKWDTGEVAFSEVFWAECLRVLKPGGHVAAFSGTRTYHRMACAIEDAGFEIRDQLAWCYGAGFPKSHNVSKKLNGARCACAGCETTESVLQHDVRSMRDSDVSAPEYVGEERGKVLQSVMQEQSAHIAVHGAESGQRLTAGEERCVEGRSNTKEEKRKLRVGSVRSLSTGPDIDVPQGRLCDGASSSDGEVCGQNQDGVRASSGSQASEQSAHELRIVAGQPKSQDGGAWENCGRCGKPIIPEGIGTALKPAWEPICLGRKPLIGTVAANVLEHGTGAINVDGCRVESEEVTGWGGKGAGGNTWDETNNGLGKDGDARPVQGRWPANIVHDGSEEVVAAFPTVGNSHPPANEGSVRKNNILGEDNNPRSFHAGFIDSGSAARFFYTAKADKQDRMGSKHPTVKPVDLMQWLCRLITPPGGTVLDPFAGSGSTGEAAWREGFSAVLCERETEYQADIAERLRLASAGPMERKARAIKQTTTAGPLFGDNVNAAGGGGRQIYGKFADQSPDYRSNRAQVVKR